MKIAPRSAAAYILSLYEGCDTIDAYEMRDMCEHIDRDELAEALATLLREGLCKSYSDEDGRGMLITEKGAAERLRLAQAGDDT